MTVLPLCPGICNTGIWRHAMTQLIIRDLAILLLLLLLFLATLQALRATRRRDHRSRPR